MAMPAPFILAIAAEGPALGLHLPFWSVLPFGLMLLAIAVMPLVAEHFWEHNRNKALFSAILGLPVAIWMATLEPAVLLHTFHEYAAFIILLGSLYVISGGVVVQGTLAGTPGLNTILLSIGAVVASLIGTTGASMVLIRPLLRANSVRNRKVHIIVFFIFIVSNAGGLLTPLGDPPLFLGFLRGVPFLWTLRLVLPWLLVNGVLLILFFIIDSTIFRKEDLETPYNLDVVAVEHQVPVHILGKRNLALLAGIVVVLLASGHWSLPPGVQEGGMLLLALTSWFGTSRALHRLNAFAWGPIIEVAVIFAGIFATMIPALQILNARGAEFGLTAPWQYFWASGTLSSFLDNAPTYLTFTAAASGLLGTDAANLSQLLATAKGATLLTAVSLGSVFMGANTYIGNGPNFMVKSIAEQSGIKMPSFFGYMAWSCGILIPIFVVVTFVFLR